MDTSAKGISQNGLEKGVNLQLEDDFDWNGGVLISNKGDEKEEERDRESCQSKKFHMELTYWYELEKKRFNVKLPCQLKEKFSASYVYAKEIYLRNARKTQNKSYMRTFNKKNHSDILGCHKETFSYKIYDNRFIVPQPENDGKLAIRSLEHKYLPYIINILREILKISHVCISSGRNELIYFDKKKKSSKILELEIDEIDLNGRIKYTDALKNAIFDCFGGNTAAIAKEYITNPIVFKVKISERKKRENVEISVIFSNKLYVKVNLNSIAETTNTFKKNDVDMVYMRIGFLSIPTENKRKQRFPVKELTGFESSQNCLDMKLLNRVPQKHFYLALKRLNPNIHSTGLTKSFLDDYICKLLDNINDMETFVFRQKDPPLFTSKEKKVKNLEINNKNTHVIETKKRKVKTQNPRGFKENSDHKEYCEGYVISQPESDGTLALRCLEFKLFAICVNNSTTKVFFKFLLEVLRFFCACLNSRKNGTMLLGIADTLTKKIDDQYFMHGEIVGLNINETDFELYAEILRDGILECFNENTAAIARQCISEPKFVKVNIPGKSKCRYVIEVDVEPSFMFCTNLLFKVNLNNIFKLKHFQTMDNLNIGEMKKPYMKSNNYLPFVRKGSSTISIVDEKEEHFKKEELPDLVAYRIVFEIGESNFTLSDKFYKALEDIIKYYNSPEQIFLLKLLKDIFNYIGVYMQKHDGMEIYSPVERDLCRFNENAGNEKDNFQVPRNFRESSDNVIYAKGSKIPKPECKGTLAIRVMEFKYFDCVGEKRIEMFANEVNEFADKCINSRTIGTIYFGVIEDDKCGKIFGIDIDETELNSRMVYTDKLRDAIKKSFPDFIADIAAKCISNPIFVKVDIPRENKYHYVIEVDVEPSFIFCKNLYFKVNLNFTLNKKNDPKRKKQYQRLFHEIKHTENNSQLEENGYKFETKRICQILENRFNS